MNIDQKIKGKSNQERIKIKSDAIIKQLKKGKETIKGLNIEIVDFNKIDGGIEVFYKKLNGKLKLFRVFNPPTLIDDPNGEIVKEHDFIDAFGEVIKKKRTLKESPKQAFLEALKKSEQL